MFLLIVRLSRRLKGWMFQRKSQNDCRDAVFSSTSLRLTRSHYRWEYYYVVTLKEKCFLKVKSHRTLCHSSSLTFPHQYLPLTHDPVLSSITDSFLTCQINYSKTIGLISPLLSPWISRSTFSTAPIPWKSFNTISPGECRRFKGPRRSRRVRVSFREREINWYVFGLIPDGIWQ